MKGNANTIQKHERVEFLDYLRGFMAFAVMIYHYSIWSEFQYPYPFDQTLSRLGIYAVSAFYILSGTSLALVYFNKQVDKTFIKDFSVKRIFRIAPLFYVVTILTVLLIIATAIKNNDFSIIPDTKTLLLSFTLLFGWLSPDSYIATGTWSIGNELVFYSIFPIMLYLKNKSVKVYFIFFLLTIMMTAYVSIFILNSQGSLTEQWGSYVNPLNQLYLFAGGFFIGVLLKKGIKIKKQILLTILIASTILFVFLPTGEVDRISLIVGYPKLLLSVAVFGLCLFAAFWGNIKQNVLTRVLKYFGDVSYSIYLIHPIVYTSLGIVLSVLPISINIMVFVIVSIIITIAVSRIVYKYIEVPFMGMGRKVLKKHPQNRIPVVRIVKNI